MTARLDRQLVIEITEHEEISNYEEIRSAVRMLPGGPLLSVDDAGAGYASLRHILELNPSFVKLDREWVSNIDADPIRQALVEALVSFSRRVGAKLIAEGIETAAELRTLVGIGLDLGQGYLLGRPAQAPGEPVEQIRMRLIQALED